MLKAYQTAGLPLPNYRLSESNILYDARLDIGNWQSSAYNDKAFKNAAELGSVGTTPWGKLVLRPIPQFKNFDLKPYISIKRSSSAVADTLIGQMPYNAQITPYLKIDAPAGQKIIICTDNYLFNDGGEPNLRAEYITKKGIQQYESPGWLNGQKVYYIIPKGIKVIVLQYRESGYNTEFAGSFTSSDAFFNKLWAKIAAHTLHHHARLLYGLPRPRTRPMDGAMLLTNRVKGFMRCQHQAMRLPKNGCTN